MWCALLRIPHVLVAMAERADFSHVSFTFEYKSVIRGHHVYTSIWTPVVGETLSLTLDNANEHDIYGQG